MIINPKQIRQTASASLSGMTPVMIALLFFFSLNSYAQASEQPTRHPEAILNAAEVATYTNNFFGKAITENKIPGAVVAIVEKNKDVLIRGYGYADLTKKKPVDPDTTLFRIASITKTFTAIAALQLSEQGKLDLDADINNYLQSYSLPRHDNAPVTTRSLLNHTSGLDNYNIGRQTRKEDTPPALSSFLAKTLRKPKRRPGETLRYSNHGVSLAGLVISESQETSYNDYLHNNILSPLGMSHTKLRLEGDDWDNLAKGYNLKNEAFFELDYVYWNTEPASALHSTGHDMSRYMRMLLSGGALNQQKILSPEGLRKVFDGETAHRIHPALETYNYAWRPRYYGQHQTWAHTGSMVGFESNLVLFSAQSVGIFISLNSNNAAAKSIKREFISAFAAHFLAPADIPPPSELPINKKRQTGFEGSYAELRFGSGFSFLEEPISAFFKPTFRVQENSTDGLSVGLWNKDKRDYDEADFIAIDNDAFQSAGRARLNPFKRLIENGDVIAFTRDSSGKVIYLHNDYASYRRLEGFNSHAFQAPTIMIAAISLVLILIFSLTKLYMNKARWIARIAILSALTASLIIASAIGPAAFVILTDSPKDGDLISLSYGEPFIWRMFLTLPYLAIIAFFALLATSVFSVQKIRTLSAMNQVYFFSAPAATLAGLLYLLYWGALR